jgi:hypothetical protein
MENYTITTVRGDFSLSPYKYVHESKDFASKLEKSLQKSC